MSEAGSVSASILDKVIASYEEALRETRAKRDQALQVLADAPHANGCSEGMRDYGDPCRCWKAGL